MVTRITSFKTNDGRIFEEESKATAHEAAMVREKYKSHLLYEIVSSTDMIDHTRAKANISRLFSNKNSRNLIREMLDMYAAPGND